MRIELVNLENGRGPFAHKYAAGELVPEDDRITITEPPEVSGEIRVNGARARVNGKVRASLKVECDRCLKPIEVPVKSRFDIEYVTTAEYEAQQALELTESDLNLTVFDGEVLNIDDLVTEELLLTVPDHLVCTNDCKGFCPVCGADKNSVDCGCETREVDPRWAGLKELVDGK
jgi:uncharacterized protein